MNTPSKPTRLFGFNRAARSPAVQDAADLGTAFGMEVTLDQAALEPSPATTSPSTHAGWIRRLAGRRKPK
jgi:hypothetical protein